MVLLRPRRFGNTQYWGGLHIMDLELGALLGGLATAAAAGGGLLLTARQIRISREEDERGNRWRRVEFVRSVVDQMNNDEEIQFCLRALDWGVGPLPVPPKHRCLFSDRRDVMEHDPALMERALGVSLPADWDKHREVLVYRLSFDYLFTVIENVVTYGERLGDEFTDDVGLTYYKELIRRPPYLKERDGRSPFFDFIKAFHGQLHALIWR
jgi:hypothetical protein